MRRAFAAGAVAAGSVLGAVALATGRRPRLPGTGEPKLLALSPEDRAWLEATAARIDPDALRRVVESMPGPRNRFDAPEAMRDAEDRLVADLSAAGWAVERRAYLLENVPEGGPTLDEPRIPAYARLEGVNLLATREGLDDRDAIVVIAHYDTVAGTIGADDNTASLALLLELARLLARESFRHSVLLLSPDMEEMGLFGAYEIAAQLTRERRLLGVICLDTAAYTSSVPGSQAVPPGFGLLYPEQVGRIRARGLRGESNVVFFDAGAAPIARAFGEGLAHLAGPHAVGLLRAPHDLPLAGHLLRRLRATRHAGRSDHRAFWDAGVPAILISDTANFRYPDYHQPTDTPDKLDYARLAAITAAVAGAVARIAGRVEPPPTGA